jgi:hypothetical protein
MRLLEITTNLNTTVSPIYTHFKMLYMDMQKNSINKISWKDFQKRYQSLSQKYAKELLDIRHNHPYITIDDVKDFLTNFKNSSKYDITYNTYSDDENSYRKVKQTVMQINKNASMSKLINKDKDVAQYFEMVSYSSKNSNHPVRENTIGWLRIDHISKKWLLIDEIQSDLINSTTQATAIITSSYEEFISKLSPLGQQMIRNKISISDFNKTNDVALWIYR